MSGKCSLVLFVFFISMVCLLYLNYALLSMETQPKLSSMGSLFVVENVTTNESSKEKQPDWNSIEPLKFNQTVVSPKYQFSVVIVTHNEKLLEKTFGIVIPLTCSVTSVIENTNPDYLNEA